MEKLIWRIIWCIDVTNFITRSVSCIKASWTLLQRSQVVTNGCYCSCTGPRGQWKSTQEHRKEEAIVWPVSIRYILKKHSFMSTVSHAELQHKQLASISVFISNAFQTKRGVLEWWYCVNCDSSVLRRSCTHSNILNNFSTDTWEVSAVYL